MKYAIISTVSSDRFNYQMAADAAGQPRLVQLSMLLLGSAKDPVRDFRYLVRPDGWAMSADAQAASGITADRFAAVDCCTAARVAKDFSDTAADHVVVAYGAPHHLKLMRGECRRAGVDDRYQQTQSIDLMRAMVDVCRLPNPSGRKGFKLPRFEEACAHFGVECPGVRDAVVGARLTLGLFRALSDCGRLPAPRFPGND